MDTQIRLKAALEVTTQAERLALRTKDHSLKNCLSEAKQHLNIRVQDVFKDERRMRIRLALRELFYAARRARGRRDTDGQDIEAACNRAIEFLIIW